MNALFTQMSHWVAPTLFRPSLFLWTRAKHTLKTNRSVARRFRVRGNGSLIRNKAGHQHNTGYKSRSRSNRLGQSTSIKEPKMEKKLQRLI
ncbi:hypothetical protein FisN_18Hu293 [Fistulifera solaris]|uniref:50S ribosomal protein L35 n=1 Tax=Fistulifera solaris TaxID=1519565 RepID=A0A1Z5KIV3_FISSO|nr:hypothetical protein FisN_18Hu293 [Fistulifera solaris]|eukprot:GAX26176.1 hypothetical protein FisN_18Hu293 [Fistulifera solaris]